MRILILNWRCPLNPLSGGAERVTLKHASVWVKNKHDVTWISGNYKNGKKEETIEGVKIFRFGNPKLIYLMAPFLYWFKFDGRFDLVFDEIHGLPFLSPLWAWKSKKVAYIHEVAQEIWDDMYPFPINILGRLYEKIYFNFYKNIKFITGSVSTKTDLMKFGIRGKDIAVIPHGLFIRSVDTIPDKSPSLTIIYVSRLVKMKGIEEAIKIFNKIKEQEEEAKFWIVGTGEPSYVKQLRELVVKLHLEESVEFLGFVSESRKKELYRSAHFLLHTSVREGFGLVVIEANSQSTPVLSFNSPGLRDTVINGVNGFSFSRQSYKEIADKCIYFYKNASLYMKLQKSSIEYSKKFNWQTIAETGLRVIENIYKGK